MRMTWIFDMTTVTCRLHLLYRFMDRLLSGGNIRLMLLLHQYGASNEVIVMISILTYSDIIQGDKDHFLATDNRAE